MSCLINFIQTIESSEYQNSKNFLKILFKISFPFTFLPLISSPHHEWIECDRNHKSRRKVTSADWRYYTDIYTKRHHDTVIRHMVLFKSLFGERKIHLTHNIRQQGMTRKLTDSLNTEYISLLATKMNEWTNELIIILGYKCLYVWVWN